MLAPCEVAVKTVTPALRALLAKELLEQHHMKETQVAEIIGVTQSAVSKYSKKARGTTIAIENIPEIKEIAKEMISLLLEKPTAQNELINLFCRACTVIRDKGLMCGLCQQNQKTKNSNCKFCHTSQP